jgi:hypothetical protein
MYRRIPDRAVVQQKVAKCVAAGRLTGAELAGAFGITARTLQRWNKNDPSFQGLCDAELRRKAERRLVAHKRGVQSRIKVLEDLLRSLDAIIEDRANSPEMASVPGGDTGYLRPVVVGGSRRVGRPVMNYVLDTRTLNLMSKLEVDVAQLAGDWGQPLREPEEPPAHWSLPNGTMELAAWLIAEGEKADSQIARACGVHRRTLLRWKARLDFHHRVEQLRTLRNCAPLLWGIGDKRRRLIRLDMRVAQLWTIVMERAESADMQGVPGGTTGFMTVRHRRLGQGHQAIVIKEVIVDYQLMRQLRKHLAQAAREIGE